MLRHEVIPEVNLSLMNMASITHGDAILIQSLFSLSHRIGSLLNMVAEKLSSDVVQCAVRDAVSANYPDLKLIFQTVAESPITMTMSLDGLSGIQISISY